MKNLLLSLNLGGRVLWNVSMRCRCSVSQWEEADWSHCLPKLKAQRGSSVILLITHPSFSWAPLIPSHSHLSHQLQEHVLKASCRGRSISPTIDLVPKLPSASASRESFSGRRIKGSETPLVYLPQAFQWQLWAPTECQATTIFRVTRWAMPALVSRKIAKAVLIPHDAVWDRSQGGWAFSNHQTRRIQVQLHPYLCNHHEHF